MYTINLSFHLETSSILKVFTPFRIKYLITSRYPSPESPFYGVFRTQNFWGWLLILDLKEGLVECETVQCLVKLRSY